VSRSVEGVVYLRYARSQAVTLGEELEKRLGLSFQENVGVAILDKGVPDNRQIEVEMVVLVDRRKFFEVLEDDITKRHDLGGEWNFVSNCDEKGGEANTC
jgi:hypothetical protein